MEGWKERGKVKERDGGVENMRERDRVWRESVRDGWEGEKVGGGGRRERN